MLQSQRPAQRGVMGLHMLQCSLVLLQQLILWGAGHTACLMLEGGVPCRDCPACSGLLVTVSAGSDRAGSLVPLAAAAGWGWCIWSDLVNVNASWAWCEPGPPERMLSAVLAAPAHSHLGVYSCTL